MKYFKRTTGSDSQVGSTVNVTAPVDTATSVEACFIDGRIEAVVNDVYLSIDESAAHNGRFCGIGTGTLSGTVLFEAFNAQRGLSEKELNCNTCPGVTNCATCKDSDGNFSGPSQMKVVINGVTKRDETGCLPLNGAHISGMSSGVGIDECSFAQGDLHCSDTISNFCCWRNDIYNATATLEITGEVFLYLYVCTSSGGNAIVVMSIGNVGSTWATVTK